MPFALYTSSLESSSKTDLNVQVSLSGFIGSTEAFPGGPLTRTTAVAVAKYASGGFIGAGAQNAAIEVAVGATVTLPRAAFDVQVTVSASATATWSVYAGGILGVTGTGDGASIQLACPGGTIVLADGAKGSATYYSVNGQRNSAEARDKGDGTVVGSRMDARAYRSGSLTLNGYLNTCSAWSEGKSDNDLGHPHTQIPVELAQYISESLDGAFS